MATRQLNLNVLREREVRKSCRKVLQVWWIWLDPVPDTWAKAHWSLLGHTQSCRAAAERLQHVGSMARSSPRDPTCCGSSSTSCSHLTAGFRSSDGSGHFQLWLSLCCILCIIPGITPVSPAKHQEVFIVAWELQGPYCCVLNYSVAV